MKLEALFFSLTRAALSAGVGMLLASGATAGVTETVLHGFNRFPDGNQPRSAVTMDSAGNIYGTTNGGGTNGAGTVFQLTPSKSGWTETVLYSFCAQEFCADGLGPLGALVLDPAGNIYGTTFNGGAKGYGEVFELTLSGGGWDLTVLYSFSTLGSSDGANPRGGLLLDNEGNLYGTTEYGGLSNQGVVFKMTRTGSGWTETVLHKFTGGS